jgi:hypothetical protein
VGRAAPQHQCLGSRPRATGTGGFTAHSVRALCSGPTKEWQGRNRLEPRACPKGFIHSLVEGTACQRRRREDSSMYRKPFAGDLATAMIEQMQAARRQPLGSSMVLAFWKWGRRMTHVDPYRPSGGEGRMVRDWALHTVRGTVVWRPRHGRRLNLVERRRVCSYMLGRQGRRRRTPSERPRSRRV